jgi:UDP-N-acetylmuramyl pentapeptide phosphotransferase/UDP-N-acetylglucosamine-1-phosphate transferase
MANARRAVAPAVTAVIAAAVARAAYTALTQSVPGGAARWARTNHRGEPVTLLEGPAAALAGAAAAAAAPGIPARSRAALVAAATGAAAFGGYDDIAGSGDRRGFRGHLGALAHGEVTTGAVKIGGIGATGVAAAALDGGPAVDVVLNSALIAGSANLLNLFDLRPGRALKVALVAGIPLGIGSLVRPPGNRPAGSRRSAVSAGAAGAAAVIGAGAALLPADLGEQAMLGDAGANALGAVLGTAAAAGLSRRARIAMLAGITGLTAASEVVSFTKVIQRTPPLHWLDMLGRRPAHAAHPGPGPGSPSRGAGSANRGTGPASREASAPRAATFAVTAQPGPYVAAGEDSESDAVAEPRLP